MDPYSCFAFLGVTESDEGAMLVHSQPLVTKLYFLDMFAKAQGTWHYTVSPTIVSDILKSD